MYGEHEEPTTSSHSLPLTEQTLKLYLIISTISFGLMLQLTAGQPGILPYVLWTAAGALVGYICTLAFLLWQLVFCGIRTEAMWMAVLFFGMIIPPFAGNLAVLLLRCWWIG